MMSYEKFARIGSIIKYKVLDEDKIEEVKLVEQLNFKEVSNLKEVSIDSLVGQKLNYCKEGDYIEIPTEIPYIIQVLSIENPVIAKIENEKKIFNKKEELKIKINSIQQKVDLNINQNKDNIRYFNYKHNLTLQEYSAKINNELKYKTYYGTKAQDIYDECCVNLNFDKYQRGKFAKQQVLYAKYVTPEGYSVWFVPHSNINDSKSECWTNYLSTDYQYIKEYWNNVYDLRCQPKYDKRLTFIKQANGKYVFIGIFEIIKIDYDNSYRIFKLVQKDYK